MNMAENDIQTVHTAHGIFSVNMSRDKKIGERLRSGKYHQEETLALLGHFISPASFVVDIGAHIGTLAIPLAKIAGRVIVFEPAPDTFALLEKNIAQNNTSIDARHKGLGTAPGRASLDAKSSTNAGANTLAIGEGSIEVSTLDAEVKHADLIKIDVEGMELSVFEGGRRLLENSRPVIFSEINLSALRAHGSSPKKIEQFLRTAGYDLYFPFDSEGDASLGQIRNLSMVAACVAPRAWALRGPSAPFDIVAIPNGREPGLTILSPWQTLGRLARANLASKAARFKKRV